MLFPEKYINILLWLLFPLVSIIIFYFFPIIYLFTNNINSIFNIDEWKNLSFFPIITFTLWQSFFSAFFSIIPAVFFARILAFNKFKYKNIILAITQIPFALPSIVVVFAFIIVFGNSGYLGNIYYKIFDNSLLYNKYTIITAHVFLNLFFCTKTIYSKLKTIPDNYLKSCTLLNLNFYKRFIYIELPYINKVVLSLFILVFSFCLTSFSIILILGGSPNMTTLELKIYQSLKYDFDFNSASIYSFIQLFLTLSISFLYHFMDKKKNKNYLITEYNNIVFTNLHNKKNIYLWMSFYFLLAIVPLSGTIIDAIISIPKINNISFFLEKQLLFSLIRSLYISFTVAIFCVILSFSYARACVLLEYKNSYFSNFFKNLIWLLLGTSPVVLGFSWFYFIWKNLNINNYSTIAIIIANIIIILPLGIRVFLPLIDTIIIEQEKQIILIGINKLKAFMFVEFIALKKSILIVFSMSFALCFGDISIAFIFSNSSSTTLPVYISELMSAYRFNEAAILSLLLTIIASTMFLYSEYIENKG